MIVYRLRASEHGLHLGQSDPGADVDLFRRLDGTRIAGRWVTPRMQKIHDVGQPVGLENDLVSLNIGTPVISGRAADTLGPLLTDTVELLPIVTDLGDYAILNAIVLVPALIEARSEVFRLQSGRLADVTRYALEQTVVVGHVIFKLESWPDGATLVDQTFVDAVSAAQLTGFAFTKVWHAGIDPDPSEPEGDPWIR